MQNLFHTQRRFGLAIAWLLTGVLFWLALNSDERLYGLTLNTLLLSFAVCCIALPLGTGLAILLVRTDTWGRRLALALLGSLLFIPLYFQCAGWQAGFGSQGWYTLICSALQSPPVLEGWKGAIWVHSVAAIPWVVVIVSASLIFVDAELEESALLDTQPFQVFLRVTLPQAASGIYVAFLWVIVSTASEMTVTDLFMIRTITEDLYTGFYLGASSLEPGLGWLPCLSLCLALFLTAVLLCERLVPRPWRISDSGPLLFRLGRWRWPATAIVLLCLLLLAGVPFGNLSYKAGVVVDQIGESRVRHWSFWKFLDTVGINANFFRPDRWRYGREIGWSLGIGVLSTTAAVVLSIPLAWSARNHRRGKLLMVLVIATLLSLPGPVIGQLLITTLNQPGTEVLAWLYDHSILAPWLALCMRCLPWCLFIVWQALRTVASEPLDVAATEGAGSWARMLRIAIPQRLPALACAWVVGLSISLADLGAVVLVNPPGVDLLSFRIFGLLHAGVEAEVAGICLAHTSTLMVMMLASFWAFQRWK